MLRALVHSRLDEVRYLPLADIARITDDAVGSKTGRADLEPLEQLARY
ncbi:hypothetical protein AB0P21_38920 [Kribbella sp. NPDC056861]